MWRYLIMKAITDKIIDKLNEVKEEPNNSHYKMGIEQVIYQIEEIEKNAEFEEAVRVVMKHLGNPEKYHPHHTIIITNSHAELVEGKQAINKVMDYVPD